jgi:uncharacterized protein
MAKINQIPQQIIIGIVKAFQWLISPILGNHCRFYPTCSQYAITALKKYGMIRGCFLMIKRLLCCHPWHRGGYDPVTKERE